MSTVTLTINEQPVTLDIADGERLLDTLRAHGHSDVKEGCGSGECGACTVILDEQPVCSCLTFTAQAAGQEVVTASHVAEIMPELIDALEDHSAVQCGFCTPGVVVSAGYLLATTRAPSVEAIKTALEGNLCRCTGYHRIISAVKAAGEIRRDRGQLAIPGRGVLTVRGAAKAGGAT